MNATIDLAPLQAHLNAIRTRTEAWVAEDPQNRWACYPVDEASFWAEQGITTVAAFDHYNLVCQVFEETRSIWGYKPDWSHLNDCTDAQLRAELDRLSNDRKAQQRQDRVNRKLNAARERAWQARRKAILTPSTGFPIGNIFPSFA